MSAWPDCVVLLTKGGRVWPHACNHTHAGKWQLARQRQPGSVVSLGVCAFSAAWVSGRVRSSCCESCCKSCCVIRSTRICVIWTRSGSWKREGHTEPDALHVCMQPCSRARVFASAKGLHVSVCVSGSCEIFFEYSFESGRQAGEKPPASACADVREHAYPAVKPCCGTRVALEGRHRRGAVHMPRPSVGGLRWTRR